LIILGFKKLNATTNNLFITKKFQELKPLSLVEGFRERLL